MKIRSLLISIIFFSSYSFAGGYQEPYVFDMGSCLIALPDGYENNLKGTGATQALWGYLRVRALNEKKLGQLPNQLKESKPFFK